MGTGSVSVASGAQVVAIAAPAHASSPTIDVVGSTVPFAADVQAAILPERHWNNVENAVSAIEDPLAKKSISRGRVKWFNVKKGYGFIVNAEGLDVFVHYSVIDGTGFRALQSDDEVEFLVKRGPKGLTAVQVRRQRPNPMQTLLAI